MIKKEWFVIEVVKWTLNFVENTMNIKSKDTIQAFSISIIISCVIILAHFYLVTHI